MDLSSVTSFRAARSREQLALAPGESFLAGGTWLFSEPQPRTTGLVDLTAMGWDPLVTGPDGALHIAATCTWAELAAIGPERGGRAFPLFRQAAEALLASFKVWNAATVGGNLCLGFPAGHMILLSCVLDARCLIWSPDGSERRMPASEFPTDMAVVALRPGEVLRAIEIPATALAARTALRTIALAPLGRAAAASAGRVDPDGAATIVVTGATRVPHVLRFDAVPASAELAARIDAIDTWFGDVYGAQEWRRAMAYRLAEEVRRELGEEPAGAASVAAREPAA